MPEIPAVGLQQGPRACEFNTEYGNRGLFETISLRNCDILAHLNMGMTGMALSYVHLLPCIPYLGKMKYAGYCCTQTIFGRLKPV